MLRKDKKNSKMINFTESPHRRYNPLNGEWVLVSPHRAKRPWQGQVEKKAEDTRPSYDPECYLCPGNQRAQGTFNDKYNSTYVFTNDFSSLLPETPDGNFIDGLLQAKAEQGLCRVICFSPNHSLTLPEMELTDVRKVIDVWVNEYTELGSKSFINHVQIFENKGSIMGCSNPHPHGQIWAQSSVPVEVSKEQMQQSVYYEKNGRTLLSDYVKTELNKGERIVVENDSFVALVPFWATWPFETMIISKRAVANIAQLTESEKTDFADIYRKLTIKYDNLFEVSFPYSAGVHQAPTDGKEHAEWHLHMHFYPPLLRSATVKKFMVGYEMMANAQRDLTAEQAAARLKDLPLVHYKKR
jgi:UDPglucose--hexose-1-phosphate uridylyltransferase